MISPRPWLSLLLLAACPAQTPPAPPPSRAALARLLGAVARLHGELPGPGDWRLAAAREGPDPDRLAAFVGREIGFAPYSGFLRGPAGTLAAREGNSLDRAVLLLELLAAGGVPGRLMAMDLPDPALERLLGTWLAKVRGPAPNQDPPWLAGARLAGLALGPYQAWLAEERRSEADLVEAAWEAAGREAARIQALAAPLLPHRPAAPPLAAAARRHFWVQVPARRGWRDLDPLLPDGLDRKAGQPAKAPPPWRLGFSLLLRAGPGEPETRLLHQWFPVPQIAGKGIYLTLLPGQGELPEPARLGGLPPAGRLEALAAAGHFRAELHLDGRVYGALPFDRHGRVLPVEADGRVAAAAGQGRAAGRALGGLFGEEPEDRKPAAGRICLELALELAGPGAERIRVRRALLGGPGDESLPVQRWALLVETHPLPPGERERRALAELDHNLDVLRRFLLGEELPARLLAPREAPALLLDLARGRARLQERLEAQGGAILFWEHPRLTAASWRLVRAEGGVAVRHGLDLMTGGGAALAREERAPSPAAALRLGVAESILEALLLPPGRRGERSLSAWTLIERARLAGGAPLLLAPGDTSGRSSVGIADEPDRLLLCWPDGGGAAAWWSLDPRGAAVARTPGGAGQGLLEAAIETREAMSTICDASQLAQVFLAGSPPENPWAKAGVQLWESACALAAGNLPATLAAWHLNRLADGAWERAAGALAGRE